MDLLDYIEKKKKKKNNVDDHGWGFVNDCGPVDDDVDDGGGGGAATGCSSNGWVDGA